MADEAGKYFLYLSRTYPDSDGFLLLVVVFHYWAGFWYSFLSCLSFEGSWPVHLPPAIRPLPFHTHIHTLMFTYAVIQDLSSFHQCPEKDGVSADEGRCPGPCCIPCITCLATNPLCEGCMLASSLLSDFFSPPSVPYDRSSTNTRITCNMKSIVLGQGQKMTGLCPYKNWKL